MVTNESNFWSWDKLSSLITTAVSMIYKCVFPFGLEEYLCHRKAETGHYGRYDSGGKPTVPHLSFWWPMSLYVLCSCSSPSSWLETPACCIHALSLDTFISVCEVFFSHYFSVTSKVNPFLETQYMTKHIGIWIESGIKSLDLAFLLVCYVF